MGTDEAVEAAIQGHPISTWTGREEQIKQLEKSLQSLKKLLDKRMSRTPSSDSGGCGKQTTSDEYRVRCKVAEVERDRISEYNKVLADR